MSLVDPDTGETIERRTIEVADATLAARARDFTVTELGRIGDRLVETLNPPTPDGAYTRRYLNLSPLPDGSLFGRFSSTRSSHLPSSLSSPPSPPRGPARRWTPTASSATCPMTAVPASGARTP